METSDFDSAFMFAYSERKGTIASRLYEDNIPRVEKIERLEKIIKAQLTRSEKHNQEYIGKTIDAMIVGHSRKSEDDLKATLSNGRKVIFAKKPNTQIEDLVGTMTKVKIEFANSNTLKGMQV